MNLKRNHIRPINRDYNPNQLIEAIQLAKQALIRIPNIDVLQAVRPTLTDATMQLQQAEQEVRRTMRPEPKPSAQVNAASQQSAKTPATTTTPSTNLGPQQNIFTTELNLLKGVVADAFALDHAVKDLQPKNMLEDRMSQLQLSTNTMSALREKLHKAEVDHNQGLIKSINQKLTKQQQSYKTLTRDVIALARVNKDTVSEEDVRYLAEKYQLTHNTTDAMLQNPTIKDRVIADGIMAEAKSNVVNQSLDIAEKSLSAVGTALIVAGAANPALMVAGLVIKGISSIVHSIKSFFSKGKQKTQSDTAENTAQNAANKEPQQETPAANSERRVRPSWVQNRPQGPTGNSRKQDDKDQQATSSRASVDDNNDDTQDYSSSMSMSPGAPG